MRSPEEIWRSKTDDELTRAASELATFTPEGEQIIRAELMRRELRDPPPTVRAVEEVRQRQRWRWNGVRWLVAILGYGVLCAVGLVLDLSPNAGPDLGMGALLPGAGALVILVAGLLTDRGWSVFQRVLYALATWLLWSAWGIASLFLVGRTGLAMGLLPVTQGRELLYFDVAYQVSFAPFVLIALRRSRLFVSPKTVVASDVVPTAHT